jgi:amino acid transporter
MEGDTPNTDLSAGNTETPNSGFDLQPVAIPADTTSSEPTRAITPPDTDAPPAQSSQRLKKSVTLFELVVISFSIVCAGPVGMEEAIASGGGLYTVIGLFAAALTYSLPLALMSSEQSSRIPACGGLVEWGILLGKPIAWIHFYLRFLNSVIDNALYPRMFFDYLVSAFPTLDHWWFLLIIAFGTVALCLFLNIAGIKTVGWTSFGLNCFILVPFVLFVGFSAPKMTPSRVFMKPAEPDIYLLVSCMIWQFTGFDTVSAVSEETDNPRRTFPIGTACTAGVVCIVYLLPAMAGVSIEPNLDEWASGSFADNARKVVHGESGWLMYWIALACAVSSLTLLNVEIGLTGRELYAGGVIEATPGWRQCAKMGRNWKGEPTPIVGCVVMAVLTIPFAWFDFAWLVEWSGLLTAIAHFIQIGLYIVLRIPGYVEKHYGAVPGRTLDEEGFQIGLGWFGPGLVIFSLGAVSILLCYLSGWQSILVCGALVVGMFLLRALDSLIYWLIDRYWTKGEKVEDNEEGPKEDEESSPADVLREPDPAT